MVETRQRQDAIADAVAGVHEWIAVLRELRSNPVLLLGRRAQRAARQEEIRKRGALRHFGGRMASVGLTAGLCVALVMLVLRAVAPSKSGEWELILALTVLSMYLAWAGTGLFHTCMETLALLSPSELRPNACTWLDDSIRGSRLSDREILGGVLALMVPRIWLRWVPGGCAMLLALYIWTQLEASDGNLGMSAFFQLQSIDWHVGALTISPLTTLWLLSVGFVATVHAVSWLVALGRSEEQAWRRLLVSVSLSIAHPLWLVVSVWLFFSWRMTMSYATPGSEARFFVPIISLAFVCSMMHFTRRSSQARRTLAAIGPAVLCGLATSIGAIAKNLAHYHFSHLALYNWANELIWSMSYLGLVNAYAVPSPICYGLEAKVGMVLYGWEAFRLPMLLVMQAIALGISTHAARLAIIDWRYSEE